jgi:hypothetical protein
MPLRDSKKEKQERAREVIDILEEISILLVSSIRVDLKLLKCPDPWLHERTPIWIDHNYHYAFH